MRLTFCTFTVAVSIGAWGIANADAQSLLTVKSGQTATAAMFGNCVNHLLLGSASADARHGTVTVTRTTGNLCNNPKEPVWLFEYTSSPGYKGDDEIVLYYGSLIQTRKVKVQ
jgi:hypothetical protein